jgi:hypothetical protein
MLFNQTHENRLDRLAAELEHASTVTSELFRRVTANACTRLAALARAGKASRIDELIEAGAWNDAALVLVELELPAWKLRRLVYEDGEWLCSLSRQPDIPVELDSTADARHEVPALAILGAFLDAIGRTAAARRTSAPSVPQAPPTLWQAICCDNFA